MLCCNAFGRTKRNELQVALLIHNKVVWLQVSDNYFFAHEVLKQQDYRSRIKLSILSAQKAYLPYSVVERFSVNVLWNFEDYRFILMNMVELRQERVSGELRHLHFLLHDEAHAILLDLRFAVQFPNGSLISVVQHNKRTFSPLIQIVLEFEIGDIKFDFLLALPLR